MDKMNMIKLLKKRKIRDEFHKIYSDLKYKAIKDGGREGWEWKIILGNKGDVGYMYNEKSFIRADVKDDTAIVLATIDSIQEINEWDMGDVEDELETYEYEDFVEFLKNKYSIAHEPGTWDYFTWDNLNEFDKHIYKRAKERTWREMCYRNMNDEVEECLKNALKFVQEM